MPQLGSGNNSGYPQVIDTKQLFANGTPAAPDDATRIDSELVNDALDAIVKIEQTLGANVQGVYGSLAARLQQHFPGGLHVFSAFSFAEQHVWSIPGATHNLGADALFFQVYDTATPAHVLQPESITIAQVTYDVVVTFATSQSGRVVLGGGAPLYSVAFTNATVLTIAGTTHGLGTAYFLVGLYSETTPVQVLSPGSVVIDPVTMNVTITFLVATSGFLVLSAAGPRHVETFTGATTVTIPGSTHQLQSCDLLLQLFDATGAVIEANDITVHPSTFDVTLTFLTAQSGAVLLTRAVDISGHDFEIRDGGIPDSTAVRIWSEIGGLNLQMGSNDLMAFRNRLGAVVGVFTHAGSFSLGPNLSPVHQLQLSTDDAAKQATSTWLILSDSRLKEVLGSFDDGLEVLCQLEPIRFRYNGLGETSKDGQEHIGFLADVVESIAPYLVRRRPGRLTPESAPTEILEFNGHAMTHILTNAVKELLAQQTALTARVDALEVLITTLQGAQP